MYKAKNGQIPLADTNMDYISFGTGKKALILLHGLGEGLRTLKGTALPMALMYRSFAKDYTVYSFGRRNLLPPDYTIREMAEDQKLAMDALGIKKADIVGVSMGGMIAQYLAIDHPEKVDSLILAVTAARPNPLLTASISQWMELALAGDHAALMASNIEKMYSEEYCRKVNRLIPIIAGITKPRSYQRFLIQAQACLNHNAYDELSRIQAPTIIVGGEKDLALGGEASREIHTRIPQSKLKMYPQWGHALYEEEKGFNQLILDFLAQR